MAKFTITDAERIAAKPRPWTLRLECQTNGSNKYWYATGRALHEMVECGWGAVGAVPQLKLITWDDLRDKVIEKLNKGYLYADTPFIRMSAGNLAQLGGTFSMPAPTGIVVPISAAPQGVQPPVINSVLKHLVVTPGTVPASLVALGTPFDEIVGIKMMRTGVKVSGYAAVDAAGNTIMEFSKEGGPEFATEHGLDIDFS